MRYDLEITVRKNTKYFVATSDDFDLAGQGETIGGACKNLEEAVRFFFEYACANETVRYLYRLKPVVPLKQRIELRDVPKVTVTPPSNKGETKGKLELSYLKWSCLRQCFL